MDAVLILVNVPFALIGGVLGLALAKMTLSVLRGGGLSSRSSARRC